MTEPTGGQKILYYTLGVTPPAVSRSWVERDISTTGWKVRRLLQVWLGIVLGLAVVYPVLRGFSWDTEWQVRMLGAAIGGAIAGLLQATVMADYVRRRALSCYRKKWDRQLAR